MSRRLLPVLLLLPSVTPAFAEELVVPEVNVPPLPATGAAVEAFVPAGWKIEQRLDGPVDADARRDVVLLLHDADPRNVLRNDGFGQPELDTNPRLLVVLGADAGGGYRRLARSARLIRRNDTPTLEDAMEEGGISLDRRVLDVTVGLFANMGSWTMSRTTYRFRWQDGCMRLIGYDENVVRRNSGETVDTSLNLLTGKAIRTTGSIEDDATQVRRFTTKRRPPVCLDDMDDEFDPGLPPD